MASDIDKSLFNIDVMVIKPEHQILMGEVSSLGIFENNSKVFDPKGLFSTEIFGPIGSKQRLSKPGYINLRMPILHPLAYKHLISLNKLYDGIMAGKIVARYDADIGDFVEDKTNGSTGYEYFMYYLPYLQFKNPNKSQDRSNRIALVQRCIPKEYHIDKFYVIPAGLRDYFVDAKGRPNIDEINEIYRKILVATNLLRNNTITPDNISQFDISRYKIQNLVLDVFEYIKNLLEGKKGFIEGKWASRGIMGGTRNVITAMNNNRYDLNDPNGIDVNHTVVGLYQYTKSIEPLAMHEITKKFILGVMNPYNNNAKVVDKKTMTTTIKTIDIKVKDAWIKRDGLTKLFNRIKQDVIKNEPAMVGDDYLLLIADKGNKIYIIRDTNNLPEGVDKKDLRPITNGELIYLSVANTVKDVRCTVTRYPITQVGSIYPSKIYLMTTDKGRKVTVYDEGTEEVYYEYPILGRLYTSSLSIQNVHTGRLNADFDGKCIA